MRFYVRRYGTGTGTNDIGILEVRANGDVIQVGKLGSTGATHWISLHCNFSVTA
jgi:glutamate synthase domain-containing protein 2